MVRTAIFCLALTLGACIHGPRLDMVSFARQPVGAQAAVATGRSTHSGELISVSDSGFTLLVTGGTRLVFVPISSARTARVESLGLYRIPAGVRDTRKMRLVSRHPYGIPADARAALLAATGQTEIERVEQ